MSDDPKQKKRILISVGVVILMLVGWLIYKEYVLRDCTQQALDYEGLDDPSETQRIRDLCVDAGGPSFVKVPGFNYNR